MLKISDEAIEKIADEIASRMKNKWQVKDGWETGTPGHEKFWNDYIKRISPHEKQYKEIIRKLLQEQANEIFENIKEYPNNYIMWTFNRVKSYKALIDAETKFITKLYQQEGQKAIDLALKLARAQKGYKVAPEVGIAFDIENPRAIEELLKQTRRFPAGVIGTTEEEIREAIAVGIKEGETLDQIADRVQSKLSASHILNRAELIARTEGIYAANAGAELGYIQSGVVEGKQWLIAWDERTCDICLDMEGMTAPVGTDIWSKEGLNLEDVQIIYGLTFDYTEGEMPFPPIHPRCYDKVTEIYTKDGWKYIKDVKIGETVFTLNPDTKNIEWNKVLNTVKYKQDKMIHLTNKQKSFDMLVTPNHPYFGYKRVDRGNKGRKPEPVFYDNIKELNSEFSFYKSSEWVGLDRKKIMVNDIAFNTIGFCKLMGYFLSEGSVIRRNNTRWQISIAQSNHLQKMWDDIKDLPLRKKWLGKGKIYISDDRLGDYLSQFGKSHEKYIPEEIKQLSTKYIRIFLDAYLLGDGNIKKAKRWKDGNFKDSKTYFTSSDRMASDLGELIIKARRAVSYALDKYKGRKQKFKNGIYTINHNVWRVYELTSKYNYFSNLIIEEVEYNDMVYDVEVDNHTILVRRNGKVIWGSNCRCTIVPILREISRIIEIWNMKNIRFKIA